MNQHDCFTGGFPYYKNFDSTHLLETTHWEFTLKKCKHCGKEYLRAFSETLGPSQSGRWFLGRIENFELSNNHSETELLKSLYEMHEIYFGGSYWGGKGSWAKKHPRDPAYLHLKSLLSHKLS